MNTTMVVIVSSIGLAIIMIASVYVGLHFGKKSAEKRRAELEKEK